MFHVISSHFYIIWINLKSKEFQSKIVGKIVEKKDERQLFSSMSKEVKCFSSLKTQVYFILDYFEL